MSLHPDHLADLHRSGFSKQSIEALHFQSVRPQDIKLVGVTSAYRIPYFGVDGSVNCFERWRLFPPLKGKSGTQKYSQATGSDSHVYMPPLQPWPSIAIEPHTPIICTEGEKKSGKACQSGLAALGFGGLWNWRRRLSTGQRLLIPTLDLFRWAGREVLLVPDSDCWREDRRTELLPGFFALGQELISRGARVTFIRLPDRAGLKQGLDDWLVASGGAWSTLWPDLERISLDDAQLKPVAAWWQRWREKQAIEASLKSPDEDRMDMTRAGPVIRRISRVTA